MDNQAYQVLLDHQVPQEHLLILVAVPTVLRVYLAHREIADTQERLGRKVSLDN